MTHCDKKLRGKLHGRICDQCVPGSPIPAHREPGDEARVCSSPIYRKRRYCSYHSICCRLKDVIVADQFEHLQLDSRFYDVFPDSITIAQTVAVWKHIVHYQERLKQD